MSILFRRSSIQLLLVLILAVTIGCAPAATPTGTRDMSNTTAAPSDDPEEATSKTAKKTTLFVQFPEGCNTSDAMTLLADGSIIVSMPNFNDVDAGSAMYRVTPDKKVEKFVDLGNHPETGKPVGPLGICVGPTGDLFLADFQTEGDRQSRVLKIAMKDGKPGEVTPVITGFHVSNAVIYRDGHLYVSETQIDIESKPSTSGVFRFTLDELEKGPVALAEDEAKDPHLLAIVECHNEELPLGADGLCFDKVGNLYIGNFSDGTVHKFAFDAEGKVVSNTIFAKADSMKSADGLFMDTETGIILVADSRANAVRMVHPDGTVETLAQNGDTDGLDGGMDQPCEVLVRGRDVIVSNMDWPVPGCINQTFNEPCTLSIVPLD